MTTEAGGDGATGSMATFLGLRLEVSNGPCTGARPENGADQQFCTDDDPVGATGSPITPVGFATTGRSCALASGSSLLLGPKCVDGDPTACTTSSGLEDLTCLAMAVPQVNVPTLGDIIAVSQLCFDFSVARVPTPTPRVTPTASPSPTPTIPATPTIAPCVGDCRNDGAVTVDEILRSVAIALGNLSIESCAAIDSDGNREVTVDEIVRAVNLALNGC